MIIFFYRNKTYTELVAKNLVHESLTMPSSSSVHRTLAKKKRSGPTHKEVMQRRHDRRKKKEKRSRQGEKESIIKKYMELSKVDETTDHKSVAMAVMELVEEIKENGRMNDNIYLKIMDQLMALNSGKEKAEAARQERQVDYYIDRNGTQDNLYYELTRSPSHFNSGIGNRASTRINLYERYFRNERTIASLLQHRNIS